MKNGSEMTRLSLLPLYRHFNVIILPVFSIGRRSLLLRSRFGLCSHHRWPTVLVNMIMIVQAINKEAVDPFPNHWQHSTFTILYYQSWPWDSTYCLSCSSCSSSIAKRILDHSLLTPSHISYFYSVSSIAICCNSHQLYPLRYLLASCLLSDFVSFSSDVIFNDRFQRCYHYFYQKGYMSFSCFSSLGKFAFVNG